MRKTQLQFLKEAVKLAEENPEMEIHFAVNSDEFSDSGSWTIHQITSVGKSIYYEDNETILTDMDDIINHLSDMFEEEVVEDEALKASKEVILIHTGV